MTELSPERWVREFVGQGKSRAEIIDAAWSMFGWDPHVVDDAIAAAAEAGAIEQEAFARGFMKSMTPDQAFRRKHSGARWRVKR